MTRDTRLRIALALNAGVVVAQLAAGVTAHSLGLLADAGHNLTDVFALGLSLAAVRLTRRPATPERSFGWHRSTILAAQANAAGILGITALIAYEGARRLLHPTHVHGGVVLGVALGTAALNGLAALALHDRSHDLNMRSALLHTAGDALASLGVAAAGGVILVTGRYLWLDPAVSLVIGAVIAWHAWQLVRATGDILLEAAPAGLDVTELAGAMARVEGVDEVHDLHVWSLSSDVRAMSAHVVLAGHPTLEEAQAVGAVVKDAVANAFAITHATLELECEPCLVPGEPECVIDDNGASANQPVPARSRRDGDH